MSGSDIAAEIAAGFAEAAAELSDTGQFPILLRRKASEGTNPWEGAGPGGGPTYFEFSGVAEENRVRDASGTLTGQVVQTITVDALGTTPLKSDEIAIGVALADIDENTVWQEIDSVRTLSPEGVPLLHEIDLFG